MLDEMQTASQPQEAGIPGSGLSDLLGETEALATEVEETPEPTTEEAVASAESETAAAEEVAEEALPETVESAEDQPIWLEDLELSPEEFASYKKRYPQVFEAEAAESLRYLLRDKVKGDREIQAARAAEEAAEEPTPEESALADPAQNRQNYQQFVDHVSKDLVNQQDVAEMGRGLLEAMGVDLKSEEPEIKAIVQNAPKVGQVLARGAIDLVATTLPTILLTPQTNGKSLVINLLEHAMPGFGEAFNAGMEGLQMRTYEGAWSEVRGSDPTFAKLPAYGARESDFGRVMANAVKQIPNFDKIKFPGSLREQAVAKYTLLARIATGQRPASQTAVQEAVEAGKNLQRKTEQKRAVARALGSGQSKGQLVAQKTGNDDLFGVIETNNSRIL